jgi:Ca2+-binding RTX toxin-like protein
MRSRSVVAALALAGATLAVPTATAMAAGPAFSTCKDLRTGNNLTVTRSGTAGYDNLWLRSGDVSSAQSGDDRIFLDQVDNGPFGTDVVVCADGDNDTVAFLEAPPQGTVSALGGAGADTIIGGPANDYLNGNAGVDTVLGNDGNDTLWGEGGNDNLYGGEGDDIIDAGPDQDLVDGGPGEDTCKNAEFVVNCEHTQ